MQWLAQAVAVAVVAMATLSGRRPWHPSWHAPRRRTAGATAAPGTTPSRSAVMPGRPRSRVVQRVHRSPVTRHLEAPRTTGGDRWDHTRAPNQTVEPRSRRTEPCLRRRRRVHRRRGQRCQRWLAQTRHSLLLHHHHRHSCQHLGQRQWRWRWRWRSRQLCQSQSQSQRRQWYQRAYRQVAGPCGGVDAAGTAAAACTAGQSCCQQPRQNPESRPPAAGTWGRWTIQVCPMSTPRPTSRGRPGWRPRASRPHHVQRHAGTPGHAARCW